MKKIPLGTIKKFQRIVEVKHIAKFDSETVHNVCSTFQIAKDAEWVCRLFVKEMKEDFEEGIGTYVSVEHASPALIGQIIEYTAVLTELNGNELIAEWKAKVAGRLIAKGNQIQKILPKVKIDAIFDGLKE